MSYWKDYMISTRALDEQIESVPVRCRVLFALACLRHAIEPFDRMRALDLGLYERPLFLNDLLQQISKIWQAAITLNESELLCRAQEYQTQFDLLVGPNPQAWLAYNDGEFINSFEQMVAYLDRPESIHRILRSAKSAYDGVSKWYVAQAFPGEAITLERIYSFESTSKECAIELQFQLNCLVHLAASPTSVPDYNALQLAVLS